MNDILNYFDDFTEAQLSRFAALKHVYEEWNSKINVISRKDIESLYQKHILHSLSIAACIQFRPGTQIIDIGTGGGFPGIPLAIFFPEVEFLLVDSIAKKLKVVEAVVAETSLKNVSTRHCRAEEIKNQQFDFAVSRAVAPLKDLWFWSNKLIKKTSQNEWLNGLICLKGGDLAVEISESRLKPRMIDIHQLFPEPYFEEKYLLHVVK